jgi:Ca2+-binding RTX toxin-like protein
MWNRRRVDCSGPGRKRRSRRIQLLEQDGLELLDRRVLPAVTASISAARGVLTIHGNSHDNTIVVSRKLSGTILVNNHTVILRGGARATVANTKLIRVFGLGGNDNLALDETHGVLPKAELFGGSGNDTLTGGSSNDTLDGGSGDDTLFGKGGDDVLTGGDGNDVLIGGAGNDQVFGDLGNDTLIWNPGDGSDLNESGPGVDTVVVNGGNGDDNFAIAASGSRVRFDSLGAARFTLDIGSTENLVVNGNGGNDMMTAGNGLAPLIHITMDGGAGNDTLNGSDGNDVLIGGDGNDVINGGRGNDVALMGAGDDTFVWNPGDGSDTVEGQGGNDTMVFNGSNANEQIDVSADGSRVRFTRDVGNVTMDLNGVDAIVFNALGGADTVTLNDVTGTDLTQLNVDFANRPGGSIGDGAADAVIVNGTDRDDAVAVSGNGSAVAVTGLNARVNITGAESTNDRLIVNTLDGNDVVDGSGLSAGAITLMAHGGPGDDVLIGRPGQDLLDGGPGDNIVI